MTRRLEVFACVPLTCALTRKACGVRHLRMLKLYDPGAQWGRSGPGALTPHSETCARCPIGKAHARGWAPAKWPSGDPIELRSEITPTVRRETPPPADEAPSRGQEGETMDANADGENGTQEAEEQLEDPVEDLDDPGELLEGTNRYRWRGRTLTLGGWFFQVECTTSEQTLRNRVKKGWTLRDALLVPAGGKLPELPAEEPPLEEDEGLPDAFEYAIDWQRWARDFLDDQGEDELPPGADLRQAIENMHVERVTDGLDAASAWRTWGETLVDAADAEDAELRRFIRERVDRTPADDTRDRIELELWRIWANELAKGVPGEDLEIRAHIGACVERVEGLENALNTNARALELLEGGEELEAASRWREWALDLVPGIGASDEEVRANIGKQCENATAFAAEIELLEGGNDLANRTRRELERFEGELEVWRIWAIGELGPEVDRDTSGGRLRFLLSAQMGRRPARVERPPRHERTLAHPIASELLLRVPVGGGAWVEVRTSAAYLTIRQWERLERVCRLLAAQTIGDELRGIES